MWANVLNFSHREFEGSWGRLAMGFGFAVLSMAFLLPGHYPPWTSFEHQALAAFAGLLVAGSAILSRGGYSPPVPAVAWLFLAAAGVPLLQKLTGQIIYVSDAVMSASFLAGLALAIAAGARLVSSRREAFLDACGHALIVAGIVSVGLAAMQWLGLQWNVLVIDLRPGFRPYANLGQPNHLATLLALAIMATIHQFEHRKYSAVTAVVAIAWFGFGLVMCQSRTAWLFVLMLAGWWWWGRRRCGLRTPPVAVVCGVSAFVLVLLSWHSVNKSLFLWVDPLGERTVQGSQRWLHWQMLVDAAWRSPWVGYGWSQVGLAQQSVALEYPPAREWMQNSHNIVLDLWIWNGVVLGTALLLGFGAWVLRRVRRANSADAWMLLGGIGAILLHAAFEYPLDYVYFLVPFGLMVGALHAPVTVQPRASGRANQVVLVTLLGALTAVALWVSAEYLRVQEAARQMRFALVGVGASGDPGVPDVVLLDGPREFHRLWTATARAGMSGQELAAMRDVVARYPVPPALLRFAVASGLNGDPAQSGRMLGLLCRIHPADRCKEGRDSWHVLQERYPVLRSVQFPPDA